MAERVFNVGLVGYSSSAKIFHIPLIKTVPSLRVYAVVQRNPTPDNDAGKDLGVKVYKSIEELVNDEKVDLVIINTPPASHYELAKMALEHGKNVVVDKPFVPTSKEAKQLVALAKRKNKLLTVYQNRRWDSDYLTVVKLIKEGTLGRITEFETHFDRHRPESSSSAGWKASPGPGSGVVYDLGTHLIDQVIHLFGFPNEVTGFVGTQRENNSAGFEDSATILLHYDGLLASIKATVVSPETQQLRYWIRGTKGSFKKFHLDCQEEQLKAGQKSDAPGFGVEPEDRHGVLSSVDDGNIHSSSYPTVTPETWSRYYSILAAALDGKGQLPVSMEDAIGLIRLVELARQSSVEKRTLPYPK